MNFCSHCGSGLVKRVPEGDDRQRHVCSSCERIHYRNPLVVSGCLAMDEQGKVLLCRRSIEPRRNFWTLPAGFLEEGESTLAGAQRETWEEAHAEVEVKGLYRVYDLPHISQVYMFFLGRLQGDFSSGPESLEVGLFDENEVPWDEIAFPVVDYALRDYFAERSEGKFSLLRHPSPVIPGQWEKK